MKTAPLHPQEADRLALLRHFEILDSDAEAGFDELVELASAICGTSISLISLVDAERQWFKAKVGLNADETHRDLAFCAHAILQEEVFEVPDAMEDERFHDNPLVQGQPDIRFYAGAPLTSTQGLPLGTLCVIDQTPKSLTPDQTRALKILAKQVVTQIELRLHNHQLQRFGDQSQAMVALLGHDLREPFNSIMGLSQRLASAAKAESERTVMAAQSVFNASLRAFALVEDVLTWAKSELANEPATPVALDLRAEVDKAVGFYQQALEVKSLSVDIRLADVAQALGQGTLLQAVLRNLLANAIKYSHQGGVITLSAELREDQVEFSMRNTGEAIPPEVQAKLFRSPCESQMSRQGEKGNGIGMYLCQRFIERINGKLWLAYSNNDGVCFRFTLPQVNS